MGIIATCSCHLMNRYWNNNNHKSQPFCHIQGDDGDDDDDTNCGGGRWYLTNELWYMSRDGMSYYVGRADDVIRTGSESAIATQVEQKLMKHPHPLLIAAATTISCLQQ